MSCKFDNLFQLFWRTYFKSGILRLEMPNAQAVSACKRRAFTKLLPSLKDKRVSFILLTRNNFTIATF